MNHRAILQRIARRAMLDKGFLIDFTDSSLAAVNGLQESEIKAGGQIRDLRNLCWCSFLRYLAQLLHLLAVGQDFLGGGISLTARIGSIKCRSGAHASPCRSAPPRKRALSIEDC